MTAYNRVNGQFCSENDFLLNQVLKQDWGFMGLVLTDWGGCHSTVDAANHGLDLEMGSNVTGNHNNDFLAAPLLRLVSEATSPVPMSRIDDMVLRNLRVMAATGLLDRPAELTAEQQEEMSLLSPAHLRAAREVVASACVLLKNAGGLLPLDAAKLKTIAVIGDNAQASFSHDGMSAAIKTRGEISPLEGIRTRAGSGMTVNFAQGYARGGGRGRRGRRGGAAEAAPSAVANSLLDEAVGAAKGADVTILFAGLYRAQDQEAADRPSFELPAGQAELIEAVCAANPQTIVVLTGGSPSSVEPWLEKCGALMMYWYGGTQGGEGLARLLFGDVNPAGHLPCTWPRQLADSPAHQADDPHLYPGTVGAGGASSRRGRGGGRGLTADAGPQETYAEGLFVGYRWYDAKNIGPQFPFGFGLSYTGFEFAAGEDLVVAAANDDTGGYDVECVVTNVGPREGATVVQAYVGQAKPTVERPPQELKGFQRVVLKPGEGKQIRLHLPPMAFTHYDVERHAWVAEAGDYTIAVGDSSRNTPVKGKVRIGRPLVIQEGS